MHQDRITLRDFFLILYFVFLSFFYLQHKKVLNYYFSMDSMNISGGQHPFTLVSLFAQIGGGKSWCINHREPEIVSILQKELNDPTINEHNIHWEPQHKWHLLSAFYENPVKYGYIFQFEIMTSYITQVEMALRMHPEKKPIIVLESGPLESRFIYMKRLRDHDCMTSTEYESIRPIMDYWSKTFPRQLILHLNTSDRLSLNHIKNRNRPVESTSINLDLLTSLSSYRQAYLNYTNYPVITFKSKCNCTSCTYENKEDAMN